MTREELKSQLTELKFEHWYDEEFHRDMFTNKASEVKVGEKTLFLSLNVFVDYHTVRIVWWYDENRKVTKCYYVLRDMGKASSFSEVLTKFAEDCSKAYGVDLNNYTK